MATTLRSSPRPRLVGTVLSHPIATSVLCFTGAVIALTDMSNYQAGSGSRLCFAALLASGVGLLGTLYAIYRSGRADRRCERRRNH